LCLPNSFPCNRRTPYSNVYATERLSAQLRGEFFNLANHPNFNIIGRIINQPNFGGVLNQLDPRQIQLGVKIIF
jgi:hypothetical protein